MKTSIDLSDPNVERLSIKRFDIAAGSLGESGNSNNGKFWMTGTPLRSPGAFRSDITALEQLKQSRSQRFSDYLSKRSSPLSHK